MTKDHRLCTRYLAIDKLHIRAADAGVCDFDDDILCSLDVRNWSRNDWQSAFEQLDSIIHRHFTNSGSYIKSERATTCNKNFYCDKTKQKIPGENLVLRFRRSSSVLALCHQHTRPEYWAEVQLLLSGGGWKWLFSSNMIPLFLSKKSKTCGLNFWDFRDFYGWLEATW